MGFKKVKKNDSFGQWFIDNFGEQKFNTLIDHEKNKKNGIDIFSISKRSTAIIAFICENKSYHKYSISADKYYKGVRCKYCGRTKYVHPLDSLGQYLLDKYGLDYLNKIWNNKNIKSPFKYSIGTEQQVYFNCCKCGENEHLQKIKNYIKYGFICSDCKDDNLSSLHKKCLCYLKELKLNLNTEYDCSILPINNKTKNPLPYDIEVCEYKLIIEVNGRQHYIELGNNSSWLHGLNPKEYLDKRMEYDKYKKDYALRQGYYYLEIPYWCEDNDFYKELINNKIEEIKNELNNK